jgi:hypothetical protein
MTESRVIINSINREFEQLHQRSCDLVRELSDRLLYLNTNPGVSKSVGEYVLRSAAAVEKASGGLLANLWDDPLEWTLPETLSTCDRVLEYLQTVEQTRQRAFAGISSDAALSQDVMLPSEQFEPLASVWLATLLRSAEYHGRAVGAWKILSDERLRGVII